MKKLIDARCLHIDFLTGMLKAMGPAVVRENVRHGGFESSWIGYSLDRYNKARLGNADV